ncbi:MAG: hypothetical protein AB8H03_04050 [Saprospiraceae bacterium]
MKLKKSFANKHKPFHSVSADILKQLLNYQMITRKEIEYIFQKINYRYKLKFITLLENNVKEVGGEWENPDFLKFSNNEVITRLAKLEEKWLGLD